MVERRWAITIVVRFFISFSRALWIRTSEFESRELVASSNIKTGAFFSMARAMEILCLSPPDSFMPRSPTRVLYFAGHFWMKSWALAIFAVAMTAFSFASKFPYWMFSKSVRWKRIGSWGTKAILLRKSSWVILEMS